MRLITRKSECITARNPRLVKSPKEAIRRTLSNYQIKDGIILNTSRSSYVSKEEMVLMDVAYREAIMVPLENNHSLINITGL